MFNISLHLLLEPIQILITLLIKQTVKTPTFVTNSMAVKDSFTHPPAALKAVAARRIPDEGAEANELDPEDRGRVAETWVAAWAGTLQRGRKPRPIK